MNEKKIDELLHDLQCNHEAIGRQESIYSRAIDAISAMRPSSAPRFDEWPTKELEHQMLCDAEHLIRTSTSMSVDRDCAVHIKALLCRVRDLENDREKFKRQVADFVDRIATQQQEEYHASQS